MRLISHRIDRPSEWFQSTHSLRSATNNNKPNNNKLIVSIHALLAECDISGATGSGDSGGFNPRTPCGVRHPAGDKPRNNKPFQSTHSLRSATVSAYRTRDRTPVSIHALLAECDREFRYLYSYGYSFNPRTPCGVRQNKSLRVDPPCESFNPRTPCGVRQHFNFIPYQNSRFQSTHSLRSATFFTRPGEWEELVSIHALLAECDPP